MRKVLLFAIILLWAAVMGGCKVKERVVTVVEHRTDTLQIMKHTRDSIYIHDSTAVEKNDSIIKIERLHTKYVDRAVHDTIREATHDTISQPYPVIKEVPAPLTWWQKTRMNAGVAFMVLLGVLIIYGVVKLYLKFKPF